MQAPLTPMSPARWRASRKICVLIRPVDLELSGDRIFFLGPELPLLFQSLFSCGRALRPHGTRSALRADGLGRLEVAAVLATATASRNGLRERLIRKWLAEDVASLRDGNEPRPHRHEEQARRRLVKANRLGELHGVCSTQLQVGKDCVEARRRQGRERLPPLHECVNVVTIVNQEPPQSRDRGGLAIRDKKLSHARTRATLGPVSYSARIVRKERLSDAAR